MKLTVSKQTFNEIKTALVKAGVKEPTSMDADTGMEEIDAYAIDWIAQELAPKQAVICDKCNRRMIEHCKVEYHEPRHCPDTCPSDPEVRRRLGL